MNILSIVLTALLAGQAAEVPEPFVIEVIDAESGRGVPLVELETTNNIRHVTDSNGIAAIVDPDLMGLSVYVHVRGHGYEYPRDGFGYRGKALEVEPGGSARLEVRRINIAERLYRVTGGGLYRDTVMAGREAPLKESLRNALVFGSDSVLTAVHQGKIYWFWGDTNKPSYPLGNFHTPGATSRLPEDGGLDPAIGVDLKYYTDDKGFAKETARLPGDGPTWISAVTVIEDDEGDERMIAGYAKIKPPLETYERGLILWDDAREEWTKVVAFDGLPPIFPNGHSVVQADPDGQKRVYFTTPYPLTRARADIETLSDPAQYEGFSPLKPGTTVEQGEIDRDENGQVRYGWKPNTPPLDPRTQGEFVKSGALRPDEAILALRDVETGRPVFGHSGTVTWNDHRQRWVMIALELFGEASMLGEIWYAEADALTGPWVYARRVVTHDTYSFYNPRQHPFFDQEGGRRIYFEGTYTHTFSGNPDQTPRYDYNQIMYRLDLDDARLNLPVAIDADPATVAETDAADGRLTGFFALERPGEDTIPVFEFIDANGSRQLHVNEQPEADSTPVFHALPVDMESPPATTTPLYQFTREDGPSPAYSTADSIPGFERSDAPLCLVWENPIGIALPERYGP